MRVLHPELSPDERSRLIQAGIDLFNRRPILRGPRDLGGDLALDHAGAAGSLPGADPDRRRPASVPGPAPDRRSPPHPRQGPPALGGLCPGVLGDRNRGSAGTGRALGTVVGAAHGKPAAGAGAEKIGWWTALEGRALISLGFQPQAGRRRAEPPAWEPPAGRHLGLKPQADQSPPLQGGSPTPSHLLSPKSKIKEFQTAAASPTTPSG